MLQICQLHVVAILTGARIVISIVSVGKTTHIAAVTGITWCTGEDLFNSAWQGFYRDWYTHTRSILSVNAKLIPSALQPAPYSLALDKVWSVGY